MMNVSIYEVCMPFIHGNERRNGNNNGNTITEQPNRLQIFGSNEKKQAVEQTILQVLCRPT